MSLSFSKQDYVALRGSRNKIFYINKFDKEYNSKFFSLSQLEIVTAALQNGIGKKIVIQCFIVSIPSLSTCL